MGRSAHCATAGSGGSCGIAVLLFTYALILVSLAVLAVWAAFVLPAEDER